MPPLPPVSHKKANLYYVTSVSEKFLVICCVSFFLLVLHYPLFGGRWLLCRMCKSHEFNLFIKWKIVLEFEAEKKIIISNGCEWIEMVIKIGKDWKGNDKKRQWRVLMALMTFLEWKTNKLNKWDNVGSLALFFFQVFLFGVYYYPSYFYLKMNGIICSFSYINIAIFCVKNMYEKDVELLIQKKKGK